MLNQFIYCIYNTHRLGASLRSPFIFLLFFFSLAINHSKSLKDTGMFHILSDLTFISFNLGAFCSCYNIFSSYFSVIYVYNVDCNINVHCNFHRSDTKLLGIPQIVRHHLTIHLCVFFGALYECCSLAASTKKSNFVSLSRAQCHTT